VLETVGTWYGGGGHCKKKGPDEGRNLGLWGHIKMGSVLNSTSGEAWRVETEVATKQETAKKEIRELMTMLLSRT